MIRRGQRVDVGDVADRGNDRGAAVPILDRDVGVLGILPQAAIGIGSARGEHQHPKEQGHAGYAF